MLIKLLISILYLTLCSFKSLNAQEENSLKLNFNHPPFVDSIPVAIVYDDQENNSGKSVSTTESVATTYRPRYRNLKALLNDVTEQTSAIKTNEGKPKKYTKINRQKLRARSDLQIPVVVVYDKDDEVQRSVNGKIEIFQDVKATPTEPPVIMTENKIMTEINFIATEEQNMHLNKSDQKKTTIDKTENTESFLIQQKEISKQLSEQTEIHTTVMTNEYKSPLTLRGNIELDTFTPTTKRNNGQRRRKLRTKDVPNTNTLSRQSTPVTLSRKNDQSNPTTSGERDQSIPVTTLKQSDQAIVVKSKQSDISTPVTTTRQRDQLSPVTKSRQRDQSSPVTKSRQRDQSSPVTKSRQRDQSSPVTTSRQTDQSSPVTTSRQTDQLSPVIKSRQIDQSSPVTKSRQSDQSSPSVTAPRKSDQFTSVTRSRQSNQNRKLSYDSKEVTKETTTNILSTTENINKEQKSNVDYAVLPKSRTLTVDSNDKSKRLRTKDPVVPIVESKNFVYSHTGDFHYSYQSGDGTRAFEEGSMNPNESVVGGFSYKDKDGKDISLTYEAGVNGYQPVGSHLPTPPPIPPAIARALKYLATKTTPAYDDVTESL